jgi:hypothetical protein
MTKPMKVSIRGNIYPDAKAAAKSLGVSVRTIYSAMARGTTDTCGLGTGARKNKKGGVPKPVTLGSLTFPSMADASAYLGYERKSLSKIMRCGGSVSRQNIMRRLMERSAHVENRNMRESLRPSSPTPG